MLDLGPRTRVAFAAITFGGQILLVLTAPFRSDAIFGFRMFPEASTIEIHLSRETDSGPVAAPRGEWSARDSAGQLRHFSWHDRELVRDPIVGTLDARVFASYGVRAQLARLQHALDYVASHTPEDAETRRLLAEVVVSKNGRPATTVKLASRPRREP